MDFKTCSLEDVFLIQPRLFQDERGCFLETFRQSLIEKFTGPISFVQDNKSKSQKGVFRGLHFQKPPRAQAKLVQCVKGKILDIALDLRKNSKTCGKFEVFELSSENHHSLFIPIGFAHGFLALEDETVVHYKTSDYYCPDSESGIHIDSITYDWPIPRADWNLSPKDQILPGLDEVFWFE